MAFGISDIFKIGGLLTSYSSRKTENKANDIWNKYNRQIDIYMLQKLVDQQNRQRGMLADRSRLELERATRLEEEGAIQQSRASRLLAEAGIEKRYGIEEAQAAWEAAQRERDELYDRLGVERAGLDLRRARLGGERAQIGVDVEALQKVYGYRGIDMEAIQDRVMVAQGRMTQQQAADRAQTRRLRPSVNDGRTFAERLGTFGTQERELQLQRSTGVARLREEAVRSIGTLRQHEGQRGVTGSWAQTQAGEIVRQFGYERELMEAGFDVREAALAEGRAGAEGDYARQLQGLAARQAALGGEQGVLRAERGRVRRAGGRIAEATQAAREATERERGRVGTRYAAGVEEASRAALGAREARTEVTAKLQEVGRIASQQKDLDIAQKIAKWQLAKLPALPTAGSSRGAVSLLMQVGAEIVA